MAKEKKVIDREMIEEFAQSVSNDKARKVFYVLSESADETAIQLSQNQNLINAQNVDFVQAGDVLTNSLTLCSELDFFLTVRSAQIEINTIGIWESKFKRFYKRFKTAWENSRTRLFGKRRKRKKKKENAEITQKQLVEKKDKPYSLLEFKNDFFEGFVERLTNMTVVYNMPSKIRILARDEFGFKINIIPAFKHDNKLKVWNDEKKKFVEISPNSARRLLEEKAFEISEQSNFENEGEVLFKIIRIFKNLFYNLKQSNNFGFIESVVYACPNSLFMVDETTSTYDVFLRVLNFLLNAPLSQIRSIYNQDQTIFQQGETSQYTLISFIKDINSYLI